MMSQFVRPFSSVFALLLVLTGVLVSTATAQEATPASGLEIYHQLRQFQLSGMRTVVENLTLTRDRVTMTFDGTFYLEAPVAGQVRSAVFVGTGTFHADAPPGDSERDNLRRKLKSDAVESDFQTAVLRFSDNTSDQLAEGASLGEPVPGRVARLAEEFDARLLKETGANISARVALSILHAESPGLFVAQFDQGKRGRFTLILDYQARLLAATFGVNAGETGLIFAHVDRGRYSKNDVWTAFHSVEDYQSGRAQYPDVYDLVTIPHYDILLDVRDPKHVLKVRVRMDLVSTAAGVRVVPLSLGESLAEGDDERLKKALRVKAAYFPDGPPIDAVQEDWDGGVTLFLPATYDAGEKLSVILELEGDFMYDTPWIPGCYYPLWAGEWYPRHGYLNLSRFDLTFHHSKGHRVTASGTLVQTELASDDGADVYTRWQVERPVAGVDFAVGRFEHHKGNVRKKDGNLPIEYYVPEKFQALGFGIKEDFVVAELTNSVQYLSTLFGAFPYRRLGALFYPSDFGLSFPSLLLLPKSDRANKNTYAFVAHETAHQWWGNLVAFPSYRDWWLAEGLAEYSGLLYTQWRDSPGSVRDLLRAMRESLKDPPSTLTGIGKGRLAEVGPVVLGHRLITSETIGAYQALIYNKGGLILRMLHFLFTDAMTGDSQLFFDMLRDFLQQYQGSWATTESFIQVANAHFPNSFIARKYGLKNLNWFFSQWVYQSHLPSYRFEYQVNDHTDGAAAVVGTLYQENVPANWFMPLMLVARFDEDRSGYVIVHANGPETPFTVTLPSRPKSIELDPDYWVLSEKASAKRVK
jgi:hypothetical protein